MPAGKHDGEATFRSVRDNSLMPGSMSYRRAYLRWIDATKRRPELRAARIAELIDLLKAGKKERPQG